MSASLVGSEMCIRDSPETARGEPPCGRPPKASPRRPHNRFHCPPSASAVSYTHLTLPTICSV
eukprot:3387179-Alexandrium_andersonii.AAC.1